MKVKIWGARGSIPTPERTNARYGGNTSCISVEFDEQVLVIDAGTGIRPLGGSLMGSDKAICILLTHPHSDHVQGFPFFGPLYQPGRTVHVLDYCNGPTKWSLLALLNRVHFPLLPEEMPGTLCRVEVDAMAFLNERGIAITRMAVNHPGGAYGYRITHEGRTMVHIPDNELKARGANTIPFEDVVSFCQGADLLCHDAQYLQQADMPFKLGWGHSTVEDTCELAMASQVGHLVLFHHDPSRGDEALDALEAQAQTQLLPHGIRCTAAYEGLTLLST